VREFIRGLRSLWYWLPVIWKDRSWDYVYLLIVMKHKIEQMADSTPDWLHVNAEEIQKEMQDTVYLLECLISDRAEMDALKQHEEIFGRPKHEFVPTEKDGFVEMVTTYPDADDDEVARRSLVAFGYIAEITRRITLQALGRALMGIERWWD
jgi:hypothetical protein